ncbi:hypothetical protein GGX14DRAFT_406500 [Mycena pura]|uniref:Uncharacterized protein n=1 Tax=Mycena pura TaxID=153505 RepID=A0AAD6Y5C9_9AGAR|nr:hypothetical protein GGX14DRAFT_406500 [Mycena pura]
MNNEATNVDLDLQLNRLASVLRLARLDSISPDHQVVITVTQTTVPDQNAVDSMPAIMPPARDMHYLTTGGYGLREVVSLDEIVGDMFMNYLTTGCYGFREVVGLDEIVGDMFRAHGGIVIPTVIIYAFHTARNSERTIHRCSCGCVFGSIFVAVVGILMGIAFGQFEITFLSMIFILDSRALRTCSWGSIFGSWVVGTVVGIALGIIIFEYFL